MSKKSIFKLALVGILIVLAFFIGRKYSIEPDRIVYVQGEEVAGAVPSENLFPAREVIPDIPILPYRFMFIDNIQVQVVDTAAIIADYIKRKEYDTILFDDKEKGKLQLFPVIQYNSLQSLDWKFTPYTKVEYRTKKQVFQPFLSASWSSLNYVSVGAGAFYHNLGVEYQYQRGYSGLDSGHAVGMKWKF